jgi:anaerobic C4-dicarboxylate transporter
MIKALPLSISSAGLGAITAALVARGITEIVANALTHNPNYFIASVTAQSGIYAASMAGAFIASSQLDYYGENKIGAQCTVNSSNPKFQHQENGKGIACVAVSIMVPAAIHNLKIVEKLIQYSTN